MVRSPAGVPWICSRKRRAGSILALDVSLRVDEHDPIGDFKDGVQFPRSHLSRTVPPHFLERDGSLSRQASQHDLIFMRKLPRLAVSQEQSSAYLSCSVKHGCTKKTADNRMSRGTAQSA